jgi:ClpP class serine protease
MYVYYICFSFKSNKEKKMQNLLTDKIFAISQESLDSLLAISKLDLTLSDDAPPNKGPAIPIRGPLFRYDNLFTQIFKGTSYESISKLIDEAQNSDEPFIVLDIDSPGGEVNGCQELARKIKNSKKPIIAMVTGQCTSAAYWLASAAKEIVATSDTTMIGGLGVIRLVGTSSEKIHSFVSAQTPQKNPLPHEEEGRAQIQAQVDDLCSIMLMDIAKSRGVCVERVAADYGRGNVFTARAALARGLIDGIRSQEEIWKGFLDMNEEEKAKTIDDERKRVLGIMDMKGSSSLTERLIVEGAALGDAALAFRKEELSQAQSFLDKMKNEEVNLKNLTSNEASTTTDPVNEILALAQKFGV